MAAPELPVTKAVRALLARDLTLAIRHRGEMANPLIFFVMVATLVPLGVTPEARELARLAPGMIWVMALLSSLLSAETLFLSDHRDGTLEQLVLSPQPLWLLVLAKVLVHWLVTGLPLTLLSPLLGVMLSLPAAGYGPMMASLALGTAALSLIGAIGAALTVAIPRGGLLLSLIVMPLYMPVLIFGASAVQQAVDGMAPSGPLAVLGALLAFSCLMSPFATAGALRVSLHG
ncbi:MAG: heme exporter protein CcmB [Porticoccaceae bacterium]|jgi:heme exporter protein B|nr:heme exporter protein CcmB [Porticoccaceae bacterium]MEA3301579.1 heme exporter protein CcmB [Pseudomonadota bacterium]HLS98821.1 heme exporter protein CcmB [Porticoccaceae bacterium]